MPRRQKTQEVDFELKVWGSSPLTEESLKSGLAKLSDYGVWPEETFSNKFRLFDEEIETAGSGGEETTYFIQGYMEVPSGMLEAEDIEKHIETQMSKGLDAIPGVDRWGLFMERGGMHSVDREISWEGGFSPEGQDFMSYLKGVTIIDGDGSIWLDGGTNYDTVYVAIVHDGSSYTPGGVIVVDTSGEDASLQSAYEILEDKVREQAMADGYMAELEAEWTEYEGQANEILTESFGGKAWTLDAGEAAEIIEKDTYAKKYIDIEED